MTIEERSIGDITIIDVEGEITDAEEADRLLRDALKRHVRQGRVKLVLNLEAVPYVDSAGLGAIAHIYISATRQGGALKLLHVGPRVHKLLAITRLLTVFDLYDAEDAVIASFSASLEKGAGVPPLS